MSLRLREPRLRAHSRAALPVAEENVAGHERRVLGDPVHDLGSAGGSVGLEPSGQAAVERERIRDLPGTARDGRLARARRPDACAVALAHRSGTARMPEHRDEDVNASLRALHIAVESLPEACSVVRGDERVDEHHPVLGLDEDAADVLLPLLVVSGPAPEAGSDLEHVHGVTLEGRNRRR